MERYQTQDGERADLEMELRVLNPYLGAIGTTILPVSDVAAKTGTVYYQTVQGDSAAQTNRTITAAPSRVNITETSTTFSVTERIKGYTIPRSTVKTQFGTIARADMVGAKAALRSVLRSHETSVAAAVLGNASATVYDIEASFVARAQEGLKAIRKHPGRKALVMSHTIFNRVMRYTEITGRFGLASAVADGPTSLEILARQPAALKLLLGAIIGVDEVLVGDDDIWYDASQTYQTRAAIVALPRADQMSEMEEPAFGKTYRYLPEGKDYPFTIESFFDQDKKLNTYDCELLDEVKVLNVGALYILTGIDESNTIVTSTTTTTGA